MNAIIEAGRDRHAGRVGMTEGAERTGAAASQVQAASGGERDGPDFQHVHRNKCR